MTFLEYLQHQKIEPALALLLKDILGIIQRVDGDMRMDQKGYAGSENVHGEKQLKMDMIANELFVTALKKNSAVSLIASEELEDSIETTVEDGYSVAFDPLDGSSLADVNLAVGSIVGIYKGKGFLGRKAGEQVVSLIAVYGPRLTVLLTVGHGVSEFTFDAHKSGGEFVLTTEKIQLAPELKMFAPGNLRASVSEKWYVELLNYWVKEGYTLRYSGGMVPDVNQILLKGGGVFTYPGYKEKPEGKLRLLYECAPMAYLIEQAGGVAVNHEGKRILDLEIGANGKGLHQRTPIFLGSSREVELVQKFMKSAF